MIIKLTTKEDSHTKPIKPKLYQGKRRGQMRNFYDRKDYDQRNYQNRYRHNSGYRRVLFSGRIQYGQIKEIDLGMIRIIEETLEGESLEEI